jgi:hypothetical protein
MPLRTELEGVYSEKFLMTRSSWVSLKFAMPAEGEGSGGAGL